MAHSNDVSRRDFMRDAAMTAAGISTATATTQVARADVYKSILPATVLGANEKILTGHIGTGVMGTGHFQFVLQRDDMQPIAVCDLYPPRCDQAAAAVAQVHAAPQQFHDFRELLAVKEIDAVCIATPDHWHALTMMMACEAGKDVYSEKPVSTTIEEGRHMVNMARRTNRVVQVGTMQRSGEMFKEAVRLIREGYIGKVARIETWYHDGDKLEGIGNPPDSDPPEGCDWDFHQGWTQRVPFNKNRWLYDFRWFLDYSGGKVTDWGAHLVDIAVWAMGTDKRPKSVCCQGANFLVDDNRTTPDTLDVLWEFDDYILSFSNRVWSELKDGRSDHGMAFHGHMGSLLMNRGGFKIVPQTKNRPRDQVVEAKEMKGDAMYPAHWQNFVDCIKSRELPISDVEDCNKTTTVCHMATCSYVAGGEKLYWNDAEEKFYGGNAEAVDKANAWAYRPYQNGWELL